jgi:ubiquinone/menaquinone biosynthesis C-methylase UbiE
MAKDKVAMPLANESLTEQQAIDITVYGNSKNRPQFESRERLPPDQDLGRYNGRLDERRKAKHLRRMILKTVKSHFVAALTAIVVAHSLPSTFALSQEKSVKPGINDSFLKPNPDEYVERFEIESREVFAQREEIIKACKIEKGMTLADIGAGTGLFTRMFAKEVGEEGKVLAVDIAENFLEHIKVTGRSLGLRNIEPILCTPESTKLPASAVDLAYICDTYHHFEFPQKTLASLHQALKPGGRVILIDFKRIKGESSEWTMNHVRAGQEVFEEEIIAAGFRKVHEHKDMLKENYFVEFVKAEGSSK